MMDQIADKPVLTVLPGTGYRISLGSFSGTGATLQAAIADLSVAVQTHYDAEKGDDTFDAQMAARQTDLIANDRFIRGGQLQQSVLMAVALGLI